MENFSIFLLLSPAMLSRVGCATRSYGRQPVPRLADNAQDLDEQTSEKATDIQDPNTRVQQNMESSGDSDKRIRQKGDNANSEAQAKQLAKTYDEKAADLARIMSNADNYRVVARGLLEFGVNQSRFNADAKRQLDQLGEGMSSNKSYLVVVQGGTDNSDQQYNYDLSQRRAEEVVRYLVAKHDVLPHKVYAVGVGEERPVASDDTAEGRREEPLERD